MALLVYDLSLLPPGRSSMPEIVGSYIDVGRSQSGISSTVDASGGGLVRVKYSNVRLDPTNGVAARAWLNLRNQLLGGVRKIVVPLLVDNIQPIALGAAQSGTGTFSDGATFSDGGLFTTPNVTAYLTGAAAVNAGVVTLKVTSPLPLTGGEWFDLFHFTRLWRAYTITDILSASAPDANGAITYSVAIRPPLRDAAADQSVANFIRPRCIMKLDTGSMMTVDFEKYWWATPDVSFIESWP